MKDLVDLLEDLFIGLALGAVLFGFLLVVDPTATVRTIGLGILMAAFGFIGERSHRARRVRRERDGTGTGSGHEVPFYTKEELGRG